MDRWALDILGPLPVTPRGNRYILVVTDAFSKWVEAFPLEDQTAETCAKCLVKEMISRYGCPLDLLSDQGRNFESQIFAELCKLLGIRKVRTTPRHPQSNGQVERFNKTLISLIRPYLRGEQTSWDVHLHLLTAAYRSTIHESTRYTPNMLMMGREIHLAGEIFIDQPQPPSQTTNYGSFVQHQKDKMNKVHLIVRKHLESHVRTHKDRYDVKAAEHRYKTGDYVWYLAEIRKEGVNPKLQNPYIGPVLIIHKLNELDFRIKLNNKGSQRVVHYNKLKPYSGDNIPKWMKSERKRVLALHN
jgi:hypothetical protein